LTLSAGKLRLEGEGVSEPAGFTPFPVTVITCGLPLALSAMLIWSVLLPGVVGVNVIWIAHVPPPAGTAAPQLLVWAKSPPATMLVMSRGALPAFVSATVRGSLPLLRAWFPKFTCCGVRAIPGASRPLTFATKALLEALPA